MLFRWLLVIVACAGMGSAGLVASAADHKPVGPRTIGLSRVDVTPAYPVRLSGYAARTKEATGVALPIYVRGMAFGGQGEPPTVVLSVENCGVPGHMREEVLRRLAGRTEVKPERFTVCSTHTHSAPHLNGYLPNIFGGPLPADQQQRLDRYTRELTDAMEQAALAAIANLKPAKLAQGWFQAGFAANRRTPGGPVDHDAPVLVATDEQGKVRGIWASYACHCTTMTAESNVVCGDWAGFAMAELEREFPDATALVTIGCSGDANPNPRPGVELARAHGHNLVTNLLATVKSGLHPVGGHLTCRTAHVSLPYATPPDRAEWLRRAADTNAANRFVAGHARLQLARLDAGQPLATALDYMLQTWTLGNDLAWVFLPGEVVVDYALRLKRDFDPARLWIGSYANDVPCYIPSERILRDAGYEGLVSMIYYDRPTHFAPGVEDIVIQGAHKLVPAEFKAKSGAE